MHDVGPREYGGLTVALFGGHRDFVFGDDLALLLQDGHDVHPRAASLTDQEHLDGTRTGVATRVVEDDLVAGPRPGGETQTGPDIGLWLS